MTAKQNNIVYRIDLPAAKLQMKVQILKMKG